MKFNARCGGISHFVSKYITTKISKVVPGRIQLTITVMTLFLYFCLLALSCFSPVDSSHKNTRAFSLFHSLSLTHPLFLFLELDVIHRVQSVDSRGWHNLKAVVAVRRPVRIFFIILPDFLVLRIVVFDFDFFNFFFPFIFGRTLGAQRLVEHPLSPFKLLLSHFDALWRPPDFLPHQVVVDVIEPILSRDTYDLVRRRQPRFFPARPTVAAEIAPGSARFATFRA